MDAFCDRCGRETPHRHMHDTAHGIVGTHMAGSERYVCTVCDAAIYAQDGAAKGLRFVLDTPRAAARCDNG